MNTEVKVKKHKDYVEYTYKGISIDTTTWESAPFAIYCGNISEEDMCCIVRTLYDTLVQVYGEETIDRYINDVNGFDEWDDIDNFRWTEEEELFLNWGGIYYEDIYCPKCNNEYHLITIDVNGKAECSCGHKFIISK
jgi:hypothetical protein